MGSSLEAMGQGVVHSETECCEVVKIADAFTGC